MLSGLRIRARVFLVVASILVFSISAALLGIWHLASTPLLLALAGLATLVGILGGMWLARSLTGPLQGFTTRLQQMAEGQLTLTLETHADNEFGQVARALSATSERLLLVMAELNRMSKEHDAGDIDVKIDVEKFRGDFRVMAQGINDMVAGHIAVKKKAMA